jgi:hypothetical protein
MVHAVDPNGPAFPPPPVQGDSPVPPPTACSATQHPPGASHGRGTRSYHLLVARATTAVLPDPASAVASHILIDSGASAHMCPHREWFTQIRPCAPSHILLWDDSTLVCQEEGTIHFTVHSGTHCSKTDLTIWRGVRGNHNRCAERRQNNVDSWRCAPNWLQYLLQYLSMFGRGIIWKHSPMFGDSNVI